MTRYRKGRPGPMVTIGHKEEYLIQWIQNNRALITKKDPKWWKYISSLTSRPWLFY
ncbi:hypothetical protein G7092_17605 [Mucilaginibacter sp. HC2]|uniref:hypothetical protein n=1 Tax=Mucilaginibacter TaxID=423349 RepID=UPI00140AF055|nr:MULTISPECIES: hypothetical protein [Mucilaginibacter]NHA05632.1 hypothetical protein [Mucilaginibacter inviolabilis]QTE35436.1 hypothetical protein J3L18_20085 [Mucilaginibacter gossypii]